MPARLQRLLAWAALSVVVVLFVVVLGRLAIAPAVDHSEVTAAAAEGSASGLAAVLFYVLAAVTVGGAAMVAFRRNIVYSAVGLLTALLGAGSLYATLSADFVAVT